MKTFDIDLTVTIKAKDLDDALRQVSSAVWNGDEDGNVDGVLFTETSGEVK